jgi:hypothetical protein
VALVSTRLFGKISILFTLGVIQIISHILRGFDIVSHTLFLLFETLFVRVWEVKLFVTGQYKASKDTFNINHLIFQSNLGLIISD